MDYLILIIVAVVSFVIGRKTVGRTFAPKHAEELSEMREDAKEALTERTEKRKEKILDLLQSEASHQKNLQACGVSDFKAGITRTDVEKLLDVSEKTARKYLNELEGEKKIKQIGDTGRDVYYTLSA